MDRASIPHVLLYVCVCGLIVQGCSHFHYGELITPTDHSLTTAKQGCARQTLPC